MLKNRKISASLILLIFVCISVNALKTDEGWCWGGEGPVVKRVEERKTLVETEYGEISAVDISDDRLGHYHLQFITLEPNSLFLPVLLHADMVFYVHTGSGRLSWLDDDDLREVDLRRGDIYRLHPGSILYMQSNLETEREKLRIYALFSSTEEDSYEPAIGAYSAVTDLILGFDKRILREAFMVSDEVIEDIVSATKPPLIVHAVGAPMMKAKPWQLEARFLKAFVGSGMAFNKKKDKKSSVYNIYEEDPDFENCNGWSLTVTKKDSHLLRGSNVGLLMVNLNPRAMMGPHWNPLAIEIAVVTEGPGMVRVVCASTAKSFECKNTRFKVNKGDVFMVPRFHPMAQMSFNNGSFVFVGFSTTTRKNRPQYVAGKSSVLQNLDRKVLALSLDVNETVVDQFLAAQNESLILECPSCAEEEERVMEEEARKEKEEEEEREREKERKREEEEAKKREEERKKEEEEKAKEEEEKRKREEEEKAKEEEEKRKREEEEKAKEEEERAKEEEERAKEEEERRKREEEEKAKEEEERRKREEEEKAKEEEERAKEEEERRKREEEERAKEEEERRKREEEERAKEEEEKRKREEEERAKKEEERAKEEEEKRKREEEERKREEEEERKREEEKAREEEEAQKKEEEKEAREIEEERKKEQEVEEEEAREREEEKKKQEEETGEREKEEAREREGEEEREQEEARKRQQEAKKEEEERAREEEEEREKEEVRRILKLWT